VHAIQPHDPTATPAPLHFPFSFFSTSRISTLLRKRELDSKCRSVAKAFTLRANRAAVKFNQMPRDC
jgi:hypothetical protein